MKYFAYGMNTNLQSMRGRCPHAQSLGQAVLQNYQFEFKGCATVVPNFDSKVDGVLWEITDQCERSLDMLEGYPHLYFKVNVMVVKDGLYVPAMTYMMPPELSLSYPSEHYLNMLDQGYIEHGISLRQLNHALKRVNLTKDRDLTFWEKEYTM